MSAAMHHAIMLLPTGRGATVVATATTAVPITTRWGPAMVIMPTVTTVIVISAVTAAKHANNRGATRNIPR